MPRPCPKRVRQLKQHTPNCKTSFPVYFFPSQAFLAFGQIHFSLFFGKTETVFLVFGRNHFSLFFGKTETCEGKKWATLFCDLVSNSSCWSLHLPFSSATMLMFQQPNLANSPRWNLHLSCSSATMLRFQQPNLWRTGHAGTLTRFSLYKINKC